VAGKQVQQSVGTLPNVSDTLVLIAEDVLAMEFFPFSVEVDTFQMA
jgi:hypothetical protein